MADVPNTVPAFKMERIHYFDHLRSLAMLLGLYVHACFPYGDGFKNSWFFQDRSTSVAITMGFLFLHLFRMPLFFFVAGFFANFLVHKRSVRGFIRNRLFRIGLPFIIFLPLLFVGSGILIVTSVFVVPRGNLNPGILQAVETLEKNRAGIQSGDAGTRAAPEEEASVIAPEDSVKAGGPQESMQPAVRLGASAGSESGNGEQDPVITQHLWFLYYLMFFCLTAAIFQKVQSDFITRIFSTIFSSPLYFWMMPLLIVPALHTVGVPVSTPGHIIPRLWPFGYYGVFFLLGWQFFYHQDFLDRIGKHLWPFLVSGLMASLLFLYFRPSAEPFRRALPGWLSLDIHSILLPEKTINVLLEALASVYLVVASLLLGKRFLNYNSKTIRFISDSSYWIYLMHYPLVTIMQSFLVALPASIYIKFVASCAAVFGIGLVTYRYMVRYTFIGTMLNGRRLRGQG